jgi:hypothetical protein
LYDIECHPSLTTLPISSTLVHLRRPCTNNTGDDGFPADIVFWAGQLADEVKIADPIAIARTTVAITTTNFLLTIFCVHAQ